VQHQRRCHQRQRNCGKADHGCTPLEQEKDENQGHEDTRPHESDAPETFPTRRKLPNVYVREYSVGKYCGVREEQSVQSMALKEPNFRVARHPGQT
jgi:hypothetical protein